MGLERERVGKTIGRLARAFVMSETRSATLIRDVIDASASLRWLNNVS